MHMQINLMASVQDNYNTAIIFVYIKMIMAIYFCLFVALYVERHSHDVSTAVKRK